MRRLRHALGCALVLAIACGEGRTTSRAGGGGGSGGGSSGPPRLGTGAGAPSSDASVAPDSAPSGDASLAPDGALRPDTGVDAGPVPSSDAGVASPDLGPASPDAGGASPDLGVGADGGGGPGGGATGLEGFCERYFECGGSWYSDPNDCVQQTLSFWGSCPARRAALDTFSDCMITIPCEDYDPDAYNPASTSCASEWAAVGNSPC